MLLCDMLIKFLIVLLQLNYKILLPSLGPSHKCNIGSSYRRTSHLFLFLMQRMCWSLYHLQCFRKAGRRKWSKSGLLRIWLSGNFRLSHRLYQKHTGQECILKWNHRISLQLNSSFIEHRFHKKLGRKHRQKQFLKNPQKQADLSYTL